MPSAPHEKSVSVKRRSRVAPQEGEDGLRENCAWARDQGRVMRESSVEGRLPSTLLSLRSFLVRQQTDQHRSQLVGELSRCAGNEPSCE